MGSRLFQAALSLSVAFATSACGADKKMESPTLPPPDMTKGLLLQWPEGRVVEDGKFEPRVEFRFEMTANKRFTYAWQSVEGKPSQWQSIKGTWRQSVKSHEWHLYPDIGRAALDEAKFQDDELPYLSWAGSLSEGLESPPLNPAYLLSSLDPATRRFEGSLTLLNDPRWKRLLEEFVGTANGR